MKSFFPQLFHSYTNAQRINNKKYKKGTNLALLLLLLLLRSDDVEDVLDVEPFEGDGGGIICD